VAVIIRQSTSFEGKRHRVKAYRSVRPVTNEMKRQAEVLDEFLARRMPEIKGEMDKLGLLELRGKAGVLPLWYAVGQRLAFVDDPTIVPPEDRAEDRYIWEALWHHAGDLAPGREKKSAGTARDHWRMCYRLPRHGRLERVQAVGTWRDWFELLESPFVNADSRILDWVGEKMKAAPKRVLRSLTRTLRNRFKNRETRDVLTDDELWGEMEECWQKVSAMDQGDEA